MSEVVELTRDCRVVLVPSGHRGVLGKGEQVVVVQCLGGSVTVQSARGALCRIDAADADAVGVADLLPSVDAGHALEEGDGRPPDVEAVLERLRTVFDPELPVNVVDLGLIYTCEVQPSAPRGHRVRLAMSMTAPGCGMGDVLRDEAIARILEVPGVVEVDVELVFEPPWDIGRMSEAARLQLGLW